ncbi:MAG: hypothetical protein P8P81_07440 [Bacteroidia bacterium]|nr:hypothetical protein [Bacteroidia bacterium]
MRLRIIKKIIDDVTPFIEPVVKARNTRPATYRLTNAKRMQEAISKLDELGFFNEIIETIKKLSFYYASADKIIIDDQEHRILIYKMPELKRVIQGVSSSISSIIDCNEENIISIKVPKLQNFEDLKIISDKLNKIFSQTLFNEELNGRIQIKNFDTGSNWIDILANPKEIIPFIGGLVWSGVIVYKKLQEGRILQQQARKLKISNDAIEEIIIKSKEKTNEIADMEANHIHTTFFKRKDNEQVERIKLSLKELADLYSKGTEIHPSLNAKKNIIESFPDFNKIENISSKIKKIEEKNNP